MDNDFIKNYTLQGVMDIFSRLGEKPYRARQLFVWLYEKNVDSYDVMTNFSKELRSLLASQHAINALSLEERLVSTLDGTEKYLFKTHDGHYVESVLIKNERNDDGRITVCLSSEIGCPMGCAFCQTAKIGFVRNLSPAEILDQLCHVRRVSGIKNNNIVFMGMGEPFLNYDSVMTAADIMNYSYGFHISVRKITISTSGLTDAIERFIDEKRPYNLAISLNDTLPERRRSVMPVEKNHPFMKIVDLLDRKFPASRNRLTIEYVMRADNIADEDAARLKKMFRYNRIKLNLIVLNPGSHGLKTPAPEDVDRFVKALEIMNVPVTIRKSLGSDIMGACGQLSGMKYPEATRRDTA